MKVKAFHTWRHSIKFTMVAEQERAKRDHFFWRIRSLFQKTIFLPSKWPLWSVGVGTHRLADLFITSNSNSTQLTIMIRTKNSFQIKTTLSFPSFYCRSQKANLFINFSCSKRPINHFSGLRKVMSGNADKGPLEWSVFSLVDS